MEQETKLEWNVEWVRDAASGVNVGKCSKESSCEGEGEVEWGDKGLLCIDGRGRSMKWEKHEDIGEITPDFFRNNMQ